MISPAHKDRIRLRMSGLTAMPVAQGHLFYDALFRRMPEARAFFPVDMKDQVEKLVDMVLLIVHFLDGIDTLRDEVVELGRRHIGYGMRPGHLAGAQEALLEAVSATFDNWTDADTAAWNALLAQVMALMAEGMSDAGAPSSRTTRA